MLLRLHSFARWCYLHHIPVVPRVFECVSYIFFHCLLPPECAVGSGTCLHHHGFSIIIHRDAEIGSDCNIYNHVTIGGGHDGPGGPPIRIVIGNRVNISTGAKVLCRGGTLRIGEGSTVAANAVVLSDVPPNSIAYGIPARCVRKVRGFS
jgi:serine O-acetyltransferase